MANKFGNKIFQALIDLDVSKLFGPFSGKRLPNSGWQSNVISGPGYPEMFGAQILQNLMELDVFKFFRPF